MAVLSREPDGNLLDVEASYIQFIQWGELSFVYLYLLSGLAEQPTQKAMLRRLQPRFNIIPFPACPRCQALMDAVVHFFMACPRLAKACVFRAHRAALCLGGVPPPEHLLLYLAWPYFPPSVVENALILAVVSFIELAWTPRAKASDLSPKVVWSPVNAAAAASPLPPSLTYEASGPLLFGHVAWDRTTPATARYSFSLNTYSAILLQNKNLWNLF
jgi:hypothetical protein